jgi:2-oxoglutarate ferredoxin oxidoreductase subunit alpha
LALKSEALGLAVVTELPLVVLNVQRAGPSTGMPTKTEQADLLQTLYGRSGEAPLVVLAPSSPSDCFATAVEAFRIAVKFMTPVVVLSDGYLGNGAEPWKLPAPEQLPRIHVRYRSDPEGFSPYLRDPKTLARPWAIPGTPGLEHRVGGLEKWEISGNVSYDPENHARMTRLRQAKIDRVADEIPPVDVLGDRSGPLLLLGWGSTRGAIHTAVRQARAEGLAVSSAHLRHLSPLPANLGDVLSRFDKVLIPELNSGQLRLLIRGRYLVDAEGLGKVTGQPFRVAELHDRIRELLQER